MTPMYELYNYYKDKPVKKEYLEKAFNQILDEEPELIPYVEDLCVVDNEIKDLGTYTNQSKIVTIDKGLINDHSEYPSLTALGVLRHELEHARNMKTIHEGRKDIETTVLSYALRDYELLNHINNRGKMDTFDIFMLHCRIKGNYETDPGERIAEIKAWKYMVNLLKNKNKTQDLLQARTMLYFAYIRGYKNNYYLESPTYNFLLETRLLEDFYHLRKRINEEDYCFDTRLMYGLPLTQKEYDKKILQKVRLQFKRR